MRDRHLALTIVLGFVASGILCEHHDNEVEDECIWEDSSYKGDKPPAVMSTHTECEKGQLIWHHPYGGLRASFHPGPNIKGGFKLCFTCKNPGITVFREGINSMTLLKSDHDIKPKGRICLHSSKAHIVLYIEAAQKDEKMMKIDYKMEPHKKKFKPHRNKACRPCPYDKLFDSVCKSDFAISGYINSSALVPNTQYKHIEFIAKEVLQQKGELFVKPFHDATFYKGQLKFPAGCGGKGKHNQLLITGKGSTVTCFTGDKYLVHMVRKYFKHLCMKN